MPKSTDLDRTYGTGANINLKPGNAWLLYNDNGPTGPCGQDGRTTSPLAELHIFDNEDAMREFATNEFKPRSKKGQASYGVVDEWYSSRVLRVVQHNDDSEPITYQWLLDNYRSSIYSDITFIYCGNFRYGWVKNGGASFGPKDTGVLSEWRKPQTRGELRTLLQLTTP
jgi:hypothetical protein